MMTSNATHFEDMVQEAMVHAIHLLPAQGSLKAFVHHNTLHAFEHLPFFDALQEASTTFNAQCLLSESDFRQELNREGISWEKVDAVLRENLGPLVDFRIGDLGTRFQLQSIMLRHQVHFAETGELRWLIQESGRANRFREDVDNSVRGAVIAQTRRRFIGNHQPIYPILPSISQDLESTLNQSPIAIRRAWGEREWEAFTLRLLWLACLGGTRVVGSAVEKQPTTIPAFRRLRDSLLDKFSEDIDLGINDCLIRFTSAYLDQGFAQWSLPDRTNGFFQAFLSHYAGAWLPPHEQLVGLSSEVRRLLQSKQSSWDSIFESLQLLNMQTGDVEACLRATMLVLPGWGGMLHQVESRSDRVAVGIPAGSLVDFVAIRLVLERVAGKRVLKQNGTNDSLGDWYATDRAIPREPRSQQREDAFAIYQVAQLSGWLPETLLRLSRAEWIDLLTEIQNFGSFQRRCLFQLVIEQSYRDRVLAGIQDLERRRPIRLTESRPRTRPSYQFICCIDDREESLRRYLEQVEPNCATFGYAGFFAIPMYYKGVGDSHYAPLCPIVIRPQHHVCEVVGTPDVDRLHNQRRWRQRLAANVHWVHNNSRSFLGGLGLAFLGVLSTVPLVARVLFPHATSRLRRHASSLLAFPQATELTLQRTEPTNSAEPEVLGFTLAEMVASVERLLRDIGLTTNFSRLVVVCGHGSASLNNPHESAYNCGACGGGRGGPNARAFCQMANDPLVRAELRQRGLEIPEDTHFVAVFHNTCDDEFQFFDVARIPKSHTLELKKFQNDLAVAQQDNAHERCRRFASAPETLSSSSALKHVQERAEDLSQTRPEYNHATNAACIVGRRSRTKGLFLDRRSFLASYDPTQDDADRQILKRILAAVIPVCAGINLEYYFSRVDTNRFGCGSKLPHNVTSLLGVMDGAASDLRTGLSEQMVEIHQPIRLLFVIECQPDVLLKVINSNPQTAQLIGNSWVNLAALSPESDEVHVFQNGSFTLFRGPLGTTPTTPSSYAWYAGYHEHLEPAIFE